MFYHDFIWEKAEKILVNWTFINQLFSFKRKIHIVIKVCDLISKKIKYCSMMQRRLEGKTLINTH